MTISLGTPQGAVNIDGTPAAVAATVADDDSIYVAVTVSTASAHSVTITDDIDGATGWIELDSAVIDGVNFQEIRHWYKERPGAGTYNVTATIGNPDPGQTYAGIVAVPVVDTNPSPIVASGPGQLQATPGTGTDAVTSGTAQTPTGYAALVIGFSIDDGTGANAPDAGTGFTSAGTFWNFGFGSDSMRLESKRITSGDAQATFTATNNVSHLTQMAVFRELQAAPPTELAPLGWLTDTFLARV